MKKVAIAMLLAVSVMAQEPAKTPDMKLTELEVLKWEKIQLLAERLQNDYKISEFNQKMAELNKQLADLNKAVLDSRKLDSKDFQASWQSPTPQVVKKPTETAKK